MKKLLFIAVFFVFAGNVKAQTVYTTKTGSKYHQGNCRYLKSSKYEMQLDKALSFNYSACSVCRPPQKKTATLSSSKTSTSYSSKKSSSTQCTGKTKAGTRCKRKTTSSSGRCYQH